MTRESRTYKTLNAVFESLDGGTKVYHEFLWYVERQMTLKEWIALDDAMGEAFEKAGISLDDVWGTAGPIPLEDEP